MHIRSNRYRTVACVLSVLSVLSVRSEAQEAPKYFDKAYRDSIASYRGHLETYHQEFYSYDYGMSLAMLPVAGEWYVGKMGTGIRYSIARAATVALATVGTVRLLKGSPHLDLNIGMLAGGIIGYFALKWSEISNVMHSVSEKNEALVEQYQIAEPDIVPGSIRYPTRSWPEWITKAPEPRHPERAREAVDKPLPAASKLEQ
ncbi:MAG: hypothetical protein Q8922_13665 [Bacteroidota bacterium]|nr:hypothetical protein [Bacteroidota bacterium]MDP4234609.1 hypothetical protein [Bacteroidota bacterium]MDP4243792.1 hypothetical protein [Bacteroidota bacterium]MDP4288970.1 hypothetical protein [Bacteroidota bacterium]